MRVNYLKSLKKSQNLKCSSVNGLKISNSTISNPRSFEVHEGGTYTLVQDYPGRQGENTWRVGIPPSGPMDSYSFRIANRLVGNSEDAAAFEIYYGGPTIVFNQDTLVAITGAACKIFVDNVETPQWQSFLVKSGSTVQITSSENPCGIRSYMAVGGGITSPKYLGSRSSFPLGGIGGMVVGGSVFTIGDARADASQERVTPVEMIPKLASPGDGKWEIEVLLGPQEAPEYITEDDVELIFNSVYKVSPMASRLGVRLIGPKLSFSRVTGGEGGSHPSNVNDNPYAIGAINFTGDYPVILAHDGPSLGGFICPITIPTFELWKIGQLQGGDEIKFKRVGLETAVQKKVAMENSIRDLWKPSKLNEKEYLPSKVSFVDKKVGNRGLVHHIRSMGDCPAVEYRIAGDKHLLIEYGDLDLNIFNRVRIHLLEKLLLTDKHAGIIDTVPGVRSLLIVYDNFKITLEELIKLLVSIETSLGGEVKNAKINTRIFNLPLAFRDKWSLEAIDRYQKNIKAEASYLPDNVQFVADNNGLPSIDAVADMVMKTSYAVLGLGDVYFGAPCAVPLDPRQRLTVPKYNPARTYTPEGAVGIGGQYMCIYPIPSPGGYQLIGRTLPIWNANQNLPNFRDNPWLLDMFDQIRFQRVSDEKLERMREDFKGGKFKLDVEEEVFDLKEYGKFLKSIETEVDEFKDKKRKAQQIILDREELKKKNSE